MVNFISKEDALAEGMNNKFVPRTLFHHTWNSIYESKGLEWNANPWVWVVEFEATKGGE